MKKANNNRPTLTQPSSSETSTADAAKSHIYSSLWRTADKLASPCTVQSLDRQEFLDTLNDGEEESLIRRPNVLRPDTAMSAAELLRRWVDEWLDSGRDGKGEETPQSRSLAEAPNAALAAFSYSTKGRMRLVAESGGKLGLWFEVYVSTSDSRKTASVPGPEDFAQQKLVFFLLSDLRNKLAKCRAESCGRYFVLKHSNRRYAKGTLCDECKRADSLRGAATITTSNRQEAQKSLYQFAGKKYTKSILADPRWHQNPRIRFQMIRYLNSRIERSEDLRSIYWSGSRKGLSGKWLAWSKNWQAIQAAARKTFDDHL